MVVIVDYGLGNLGSIQNMLKRLGIPAVICSDPEMINNAKKLILPGVGSFDTGIQNLHNLGLWDILNKRVLVDKVPILGICLGIQLMCKSSEEGSLPGLGWFNAEVLSFRKKFIQEKTFPVPNMGWREVTKLNSSPLTMDLHENSRYYFVHSYYLNAFDHEDVILTAHYGFEYVVALNRNNIFGVQFHPEKSHKYGFGLMRKFAHL